MGYSSHVFAQFALCLTQGIQKETLLTTFRISCLVNTGGLKYGNKKIHLYIFVVMDTDLHSEQHTTLS